ncbi:YMGG-like glycine zipper-containing protein [Succinivibrio sp.]|uniref:YMGG-like glycine zipper-containing protein n=1 Tax=Succinivibrio sp. TaxID=2053619 RepID=UPI0025FC3732|nr:YMGG-like glycine zipper-containing protein [Succinivibrio sp.]MBQ9220892.1 hypothetical protein [Succinivibrio sp.]
MSSTTFGISSKITAFAVAITLTLGSCGCTNIKDDSTRTKTEGTLAGAGIGAAVGAGLGALFGGSKGALAGAAIGAGVGSLSGYFYGKHVADKKAEYASREEWLDACIDRSRQVTADTKKYNEQLKKDIAALDKETKTLTAKNANTDKKTLKEESKKIASLQSDTQKNIKNLESEVEKQKTVLADAKKNGDNQEAKILDAEIKKLNAQIKEMKEYNNKLASISARVAV